LGWTCNDGCSIFKRSWFKATRNGGLMEAG
jgi:hypothetical protein